MVNTSYCSGCKKQFRKSSRTGYCAECFHKNIDSVKTKYSKSRWESGVARVHHWKVRGVQVPTGLVEFYNSVDKCQLCDKTFDGDKCLDHCHETGLPRGVLCRQCNAALGKLGDNLDTIIQKLEAYREASPKW